VNKLKRKATLTLTTVAMLAGSVAVSSRANAAASSPAAACGSGYHVIDHHNVDYATIYLLYNGSTDCVVTWKTAFVGTPSPTQVEAYIERQRNPDVAIDVGRYAFYAGPAYLYAKGTCVDWGGYADPPGGTSHMWYSGWSHCG
jgi:hypothetical protein